MRETKVADFFIGLACALGLAIGAFSIALVVPKLIPDRMSVPAMTLIAVVVPVLSLAGIVASLVRRRPFFALGIVVAWALPFLAMGACLLIVGGFMK